MHRLPFYPGHSQVQEPLKLIHMDLVSPMEVESLDRKCYVMSIIDDHTRIGYVDILVHKNEAMEKFVKYRAEIEKNTGRAIKGVMYDNGGEFVNEKFKAYLKANGIAFYMMVPYSPQQNGVAE